MPDSGNNQSLDALTASQDLSAALATFSSSHSSLLFINCCFAFSFSGLFWLFDKAMAGERHQLFWVPLAIYLIYVVWRQYSIYYIPLQHFRNKPESEGEEFTTFLITIVVGAFAFICIYFPNLGWPWLIVIIILNLVKVNQMKKILEKAPCRSTIAIQELRKLLIHLVIYFALLLALIIALGFYLASWKGWLHYLVAGGLPFFIYGVMQWVYNTHYVLGPTLPPEEYIAAVAEAFNQAKKQTNND